MMNKVLLSTRTTEKRLLVLNVMLLSVLIVKFAAAEKDPDSHSVTISSVGNVCSNDHVDSLRVNTVTIRLSVFVVLCVRTTNVIISIMVSRFVN